MFVKSCYPFRQFIGLTYTDVRLAKRAPNAPAPPAARMRVVQWQCAPQVAGSGAPAIACFKAAKQAGSSAVPTVFSIMASACGTGMAPR